MATVILMHRGRGPDGHHEDQPVRRARDRRRHQAPLGSGGARRIELDSVHGESLIIDVEDDESVWLMPAIQRMARLLQLPEDWDSYGAYPVDPRNVAAAVDLLGAIMRPDTPVPDIVPTNRGGVQLEWNARDMGLEVEVTHPSLIHVLYEDYRDNLTWEGDVSGDVTRLAGYLAELSRRS